MDPIAKIARLGVAALLTVAATLLTLAAAVPSALA
jgi:hypothetical protein